MRKAHFVIDAPTSAVLSVREIGNDKTRAPNLGDDLIVGSSPI